MKQDDSDKSHLGKHLGKLLSELVGFDTAGEWGFREALASISKISRVGSGEDARMHVYANGLKIPHAVAQVSIEAKGQRVIFYAIDQRSPSESRWEVNPNHEWIQHYQLWLERVAKS
ncbi:MAG: hypothetical protein NWT08_11435 [Akkermansiaceae bacterium]|jgi:hypothetical protein|nr:hypothetical protein [Akkermansiaceae bacterium]MDP4646110.1 hypothetical protein [Akkermansiaceae bacterium]MDP4720909.1 hypothetical protein [Akkermansiaceae bacterium]MDP4780732.1 hypothetical protein [Akkermansiaceae bacterium]MDP4845678.1 hypothetical protein [Akkermansiaceae bacterium]